MKISAKFIANKYQVLEFIEKKLTFFGKIVPISSIGKMSCGVSVRLGQYHVRLRQGLVFSFTAITNPKVRNDGVRHEAPQHVTSKRQC